LPGRAAKILVVEDESEIRFLIETILRPAGYEVVSTGDPTRALELARQSAPDLILCDIAMPGLDGYGVLKALQSDPGTASCPVVFVTAHKDFSQRVRAFRFGVVDYVTKPFTRDILLRKVERVLEGRHARPGVREEGGEEVPNLLEQVRRESRSGVLTVTHEKGEGRALIHDGRVVESTIPENLGPRARAQFQELDLDWEQILSHDPSRLPGDPAVVPALDSLPEVLRTVLVVDDNRLFRTFLKDTLTRRGFTVHEASDGEEGLRQALEKRPWLVLTDVAMPKVDGIEFCRRLRAHSLLRHTHLIFLSGWDDYKDRYRGLEAGADEYLSKDTPIRELLIRIQIGLKRYADLGARGGWGPGMEGRLELVGTPVLLQMCHLSRLTGVLRVGSGERTVDVRFREGEIVGAKGASATGPEAVFELVALTEGHFSFAPGDPGPGEPLGQTFTQVLLEACRRLDEKRRDAAARERPGVGD
jgi:DNA-binding response OmpR family regulator